MASSSGAPRDEEEHVEQEEAAVAPFDKDKKKLSAEGLKKKIKSSFDVLAAEGVEVEPQTDMDAFETRLTLKIKKMEQEREANKKVQKQMTAEVRKVKRVRQRTMQKIAKLDDQELLLACDLRAERKKKMQVNRDKRIKKRPATASEPNGEEPVATQSCTESPN